MTVRIGINGIGRIGRNLWRIVHTGVPDVEIAVANDTADLATVAHLLRHDTIRGRFPTGVGTAGEGIVLDGQRVPVTHEPDPGRIDWSAHGVDLVVEATGQFVRGAAARRHLRGGARRVIISTASPDADVSLMTGINEHVYDPGRHHVVSNSCCTTYCIGMVAHALHQTYGIRTGSVTIAYSHGSRPGPLLDGVFGDPLAGSGPLRPNLRMARANATTIVPANVPGVRHALDRVLPELSGRIMATAMRVPVRAVSAATMTLRLAHPAGAADVNAVLETASASLLKGYLEVSHEPLTSSDVVGSPASCVVDAGLTASLGDLVRVVGWYDNEWGYAHRLVDLIRILARRAS